MLMYPSNFTGTALKLDNAIVMTEAKSLGCESAAIYAVYDVESAGGGFLPDNRPKILFEAHVFDTLTKGKWRSTHPNISTASWDPKSYGAAGAHQYDRLVEALALNSEAALESASWGGFQILGTNFRACGFNSVFDYVAATCQSEGAQLAAFSAFCQSKQIIVNLIHHDWTRFALHYNGFGQVGYYADKLSQAYTKRLGNSMAVILHEGIKSRAVLSLQQALTTIGFYEGAINSQYGPATADAVWRFEADRGLKVDGVAGPEVFSQLGVMFPTLEMTTAASY
jgi:N-acetylmuramidase-like protein/putative peptidoglycan binding protein